MEYFEGTLADLLKEEYGGEDCYGEDNKVISKLLFEKPENIIFTTSDIDLEAVDALTVYLFKEGSDYFEAIDSNFYLSIKLGFRFVYEYAEGGLSTFFISKRDKELFEQLINKAKIN